VREKRRLAAPVILAVLLVFAAPLVGAWHQHNGAADLACSMCLLSQQASEQPHVVEGTTLLAPMGPPVEAPDPGGLPGAIPRNLPARAPPPSRAPLVP
jgi:hypothetical protein